MGSVQCFVQGRVCSLGGDGALSSRVFGSHIDESDGDDDHQQIYRDAIVLPGICCHPEDEDIYILDHVEDKY